MGMDWRDIINGAFEGLAAFFVLLHVLKLRRDKQVKGVSILAVFFFTAWGVWNATVYYPGLEQWLSWAGGIAVAGMNGVYVGMLVYYSRRFSHALNSSANAVVGAASSHA